MRKELYTASEVATLLGRTPRWVYRQVRSGKACIPGLRRLGARIAFLREDVDAWLRRDQRFPRSGAETEERDPG